MMIMKRKWSTHWKHSALERSSPVIFITFKAHLHWLHSRGLKESSGRRRGNAWWPKVACGRFWRQHTRLQVRKPDFVFVEMIEEENRKNEWKMKKIGNNYVFNRDQTMPCIVRPLHALAATLSMPSQSKLVGGMVTSSDCYFFIWFSAKYSVVHCPC